jgi:hypothetical protein
MKIKLPLSREQKLTVLCRIEPGCLGPEGEAHIQEFCDFAQKQVESIDADFVHWELVPRHDKTLPEMQYKINGKKLSHDKAEKYLALFKKELDVFEDHLHEKVAHLVDEYLGH